MAGVPVSPSSQSIGSSPFDVRRRPDGWLARSERRAFNTLNRLDFGLRYPDSSSTTMPVHGQQAMVLSNQARLSCPMIVTVLFSLTAASRCFGVRPRRPIQ
mgnify:CR=1 FL=1